MGHRLIKTFMRPYRRARKRLLELWRQWRPPPNSAETLLAHIYGLARANSRRRAFPDGPVVAFVVPVYDTRTRYLDDLVAALRAQPRGGWELLLCDDGSRDPATCAWLDRRAGDADLRILRLQHNRGIAAATNAGIAAARAPWIGLMDHDDALAPFALERILDALEACPECQFLYTDEIIADGELRPVDLFLKPAFDPVLLSGVNYINHLSLYRRERLTAIGMLREGFEGSQDYDLLLRYTQGLPRAAIRHLPYPAYLWRRDGTSYSARFLERATTNARRALAEAHATPARAPLAVDAARGGLHRLRFDRADGVARPLVSVIIPSRDSHALISRTLEGLLEGTDYPSLEVIVIDNGSVDARVLELYERRSAGPTPFQAVIEPEPFNFSRAINKGIARARGDLILWLNNDVEILEPGWLTEMASCFAYPDVGVVGAKLLYPDRTLQHAGVIVGFGGLAGHWHLHAPEHYPAEMGRLWVRQSLSCVTGACLLVSRDLLARIGGLDEERFAIAYNDVDFCMRAVKAGYRIVWTPFAALIHHESASRGSDETPANIERFRREQNHLRAAHATDAFDDPAISPWYSKDRSGPVPVALPRLPDAR